MNLSVGVSLWVNSPAWDPGDWINFAIILGIAAGAWYASISAEHRLQTLRQTSDFDEAAMDGAG